MHPLPVSLPKECRKAEKIVRSFMEPSRNGLDGVIPRQVLANAKGFCIFTVVKAGFVFSARGGSGIVIARLPDGGGWSAPSAIGTAGMGFGTQVGAEMTEFLIVLNSESALKSFMSAGSLTIGGNLSVAVGPLGRNGEVAGSVNTKGKVAAMYSYSKTKGLFGGLSIEGSVVLERQDANCIAYGDDYVTAKKLLTGVVPVPPWASGLIEMLDRSTGVVKGWIQEEPRANSPDNYAFGNGVSSEPSRPKLKGFFSSSNTIKKGKGKPLTSSGNSSKKEDRYLDTPRKSYDGGIGARSSLDDEGEGPSSLHDHQDYNPFYASDAAYRANVTSRSGTLFSEPFARLGNEGTSDSQTKTGTSRFSTYFESDFDPTAPPPGMQVAHRASSSISHTRAQNDDDPFGIFSETPSAPIPPNIAYNARQLQQSQQQTHQSHPSYDGSTPALTSSSSIPSPTSPTFSQSSHRYNPSITSPKPIRQLSIKSLNTSLEPGAVRAIAMYDFNAQELGDLNFRKGDVIVVTKKSDTVDDWWTGRVDGLPRREGIFPANFVELCNVDL